MMILVLIQQSSLHNLLELQWVDMTWSVPCMASPPLRAVEQPMSLLDLPTRLPYDLAIPRRSHMEVSHDDEIRQMRVVVSALQSATTGLRAATTVLEEMVSRGATYQPSSGQRNIACATGEEGDEGSLVWTVPEAGERLGISRHSAYELARQGRIPAIRLGRRLAVPKAALRRMLEEGHWQGQNGI